VQVRRHVGGYVDAEFIRVDEADIGCLTVESFGYQEQGVHLSGGVVLRVQSFTHVLKEGFAPVGVVPSTIFRNPKVLVECITSIGHSPTVRAAAVVCTEMRDSEGACMWHALKGVKAKDCRLSSKFGPSPALTSPECQCRLAC
jgi:hypothetical protein